MSAKRTCSFWLRNACTKKSCGFLHGYGPPNEPEDDMLIDTGVLLETITSQDHTGSVERDESIALTDYQFLSSYNWVNTQTPVIYVPGAPPVWQPRATPFSIPRDEGTCDINRDSACYAAYPAEALFLSLALMQPNLRMQDFDLVTDRSCFRKLFSFVSEYVDQSFRVDVQLQGGIMMLSRWTIELKQMVLPERNAGYGASFEKATTSFDQILRDSSGHHRVVQYKLGDLRCLVQYEADGCTENLDRFSVQRKVERNTDSKVLSDAQILLPAGLHRAQIPGSVQVQQEGRVVRPTSIIEIKTTTVKHGLNFEKVVPQLWFAQTPTLIVGYHRDGEFQKVLTRSTQPMFERFEAQHQTHLRRLVVLLKNLSKLARSTENKRCIVICDGEKSSPRLKVYRSKQDGAVLPNELISMYDWA